MLSYQFFELIAQTMFHEILPVITGPIFEKAIYPYDTFLKKVCPKLIGETTPIQLVIRSLVATFKSHTINTLHIHHPDIISDILLTWKDHIFVLHRLELSSERLVVLAYGLWCLVKQGFTLSPSQVSLQKPQRM